MKKKPLYCLLIYDIMSTIWSLYSKEIFNTIIMACGIISHKIDFVKHFFTCFVFICNTSISIVFNKICAIQNSQCNMLECNDRILSNFLKKRRIQASLVSLKSTLVKKNNHSDSIFWKFGNSFVNFIITIH